jgi:hypothetical protein
MLTDSEFLDLTNRAGRGDTAAAAALPMSDWAEVRRSFMTPQTVAANARLERARPRLYMPECRPYIRKCPP